MVISAPRVTGRPDRRDLRLKRVVDALRPRGAPYKVYDTKIPGFGIRVAPTGHRGYFLSYRHQGVKRTMHLGDTRTLTPDEARKIATQASVSVDLGRDPLAERRIRNEQGVAAARARRSAPTVGDIADRYLTSLALTRSAKWAREARRLYSAHIAGPLGSTKAADLDTAAIRRLHERLRANPATANRVRAVVSAVMSRAIEDGARPTGSINPTDGVAPYAERPRERYLSASEWRRLAEAIASERHALDQVPDHDTRPFQLDAVILLLLTGGRRDAVTRRRWKDVNWESHILTIDPPHKGATKLYLGQPALSLLRRWSAERGERHPYIFPGQQRRTGERAKRGADDKRPVREARPIASIRPVWESLCKRAKLENLRPHDLRRSFATVAGDVGVSNHLIGGLLGHVVPGVTGVYAHRTDPALIEAADRTAAEVASRLRIDAIRDRKVLPISRGA